MVKEQAVDVPFLRPSSDQTNTLFHNSHDRLAKKGNEEDTFTLFFEVAKDHENITGSIGELFYYLFPFNAFFLHDH